MKHHETFKNGKVVKLITEEHSEGKVYFKEYDENKELVKEWEEILPEPPPPTFEERIEALEKGSSTGDKVSERGIASRLDDLEDRIKKLEG